MKIQITNKRKKYELSLFSEKALVILVSVVTLLLQTISFATTWNGAKVYLENIFPYAALCFAIAIQATAYFFSNSLRKKVNLLKLTALLTAMCCSTYYSYIGIYHSVNSPVIYLQESYLRISSELNQIYRQELEETITTATEAVNDAGAAIIHKYTALATEKENILACEQALKDLDIQYTSNMKAPKQNAFETYEEYAAAYQAYINSISQSKNMETQAVRTATLSSYDFSSIEDLNITHQENTASLNALQTALGVTGDTDLPATLTNITGNLNTAIPNTADGRAINSGLQLQLNRLLQAAKLCGYEPEDPAQLTAGLKLAAKVSSTALMKDYDTLVQALPEGMVTDANAMSLKTTMDAEITNALLQLNSLLPENKQLSYTDSSYQITDLYQIPMQALSAEDTRDTACFSLIIAAMIDALSLLFAISLKGRKPLWKRHTLFGNTMEEYEPLIYACLPASTAPAHSLSDFLKLFHASPQTEGDGYMLQTALQNLQAYPALTALLCQINLAKIIPAGLFGQEAETLLLKARFVFWANTMIYEENTYE